MKKILLLMVMAFALIQVASAVTINGSINFTPSAANTTYQHYGISTGLEQISVESDSINFNTVGKSVITLTATDHGSDLVYFNYDVSGKKLYINITKTGGAVDLTGLSALGDNTLHQYEITKNAVLLDDYLSSGSYSLSGAGQYVVKANTVLDNLGSYSYNYDAETHETERVSWNISMTETIADQFYEVVLVDTYDNEYPATYSTVGNNRTYVADFNIPTTPTVDTNVTFWWLARMYDGGSIESERFNSTVITLDVLVWDSLLACDTTPGYQSGLYFNYIDEDSMNGVYDTLNKTNVEYEVRYWYGEDSGQTYIQENYIVDSIYDSYFFRNTWCSKGTGSDYLNYRYDVYVKFETPAAVPIYTQIQTCDGSNCSITTNTTYGFSDTFTQRFYYFNHKKASGSLALPAIGDSTDYNPRFVKLRSSLSSANLENIYVSMYRYFQDVGTWVEVQVGKTDSEGNTIFYVRDRDTDYKFTFSDSEGNSYETTPTMRFDCPTSYCTTTFYTDPESVDTSTRPTLFPEISYNNNTGIIESRWYVGSARELTVTTTVTKSTATGDYVICEETTTDTSDIHYCDVGDHRGTVTVVVTSEYNDEFKVEASDSYVISNVGLHNDISFEDAAFWAFIILMVIVFAALHSPVSAMIAMIFGLLFISLLGLLSGLTAAVVVSAGVIAAIISFKVKA